MDTGAEGRAPNGPLIVRLAAAAIQAAAFYALHLAIRNGTWPVGDPAWMYALYTSALVVPLSLHLLAEHARRPAMWADVALTGLLFAYLAWNAGDAAAGASAPVYRRWDQLWPTAITLAVLWLMVLPFEQVKLAHGSWLADYRHFFSVTWRNKVMLAEALLFTGLLWALLAFWANLFLMLKQPFFGRLFLKPLFAYPVTALSFGVAMHLVHSVDQLVSAVLKQLLSLLKWLLLVSALILVLFALALLPNLPELVAEGRRAVGSEWLLWLIAGMVLLLNAAYRDGKEDSPFAFPLALALRLAVPFMVIVAATALYSLVLRADAQGLTAMRVWGLIVAAAALAYSCGYAYAAIRPGPWMGKMGDVNVAVALGLIAVIAATQTPLLSPLRLSAASQKARILAGSGDMDGAYRYLRFRAGRYGLSALDELSDLRDPRFQEIREAAIRWRAQPSDVARLPPSEATLAERLTGLSIFPAGRTLDADLQSFLGDEKNAAQMLRSPLCSPGSRTPCFGLYVDLDGDGQDEFVLLSSFRILVYTRGAGSWRFGSSAVRPVPYKGLEDALEAGDYGPQAHRWRNLRIGKQVIEVPDGQPN
jgi:hypothetical protein